MINQNKKILQYLALAVVFLILIKPTDSQGQNKSNNTELKSPPITSIDKTFGKANYNVRLKSLKGKILELDSLKNKVIFAHVWATNCSPCIPELPSLKHLHESLSSDSVAFLMISEDSSAKAVKKFLSKRNLLTLPVYFLQAGWPFKKVAPGSRLMVIMPATYVIGKSGNIRYKHLGAAQWNNPKFKKFIRELIKEK